MRSLAKDGIEIHKRKAAIISSEQEDTIWNNGMLSENTAQQLLDTVFYLNDICFCLRGYYTSHSLRQLQHDGMNTAWMNHLFLKEQTTARQQFVGK